MTESRPMMTRNDMWQMLAGYVLAVSALVFWPDKATWTRGTVLVIGLGALLVGWLGWIVLAGRRLPRLSFRSGPRQPMMPGALVIAFIVFTVAFIVREGLRQAWPDEYVVFPEAAPDGMVVWLETPINTARQLIAYFAVAFGGIALGSGLLQAFHTWRAQREGRT